MQHALATAREARRYPPFNQRGGFGTHKERHPPRGASRSLDQHACAHCENLSTEREQLADLKVQSPTAGRTPAETRGECLRGGRSGRNSPREFGGSSTRKFGRLAISRSAPPPSTRRKEEQVATLRAALPAVIEADGIPDAFDVGLRLVEKNEVLRLRM